MIRADGRTIRGNGLNTAKSTRFTGLDLIAPINNGRRANSVERPGYGSIFLEHLWRDGTVTFRTY